MIGINRAGGVFLFSILMGATTLEPSASFADAPGDDPVVGLKVQDGTWAIMTGTSLKSTLEGWAQETDWQVIWDAPVDYKLRASVVFHGSFENVVGRLIDAVHQDNPSLRVTLYRGNMIVHVESDPITSN